MSCQGGNNRLGSSNFSSNGIVEMRNLLSRTRMITYVLKIFSILCIVGAIENAFKSNWWEVLMLSGCALLFIAASGNPAPFSKPIREIADLLQTKEEESTAIWLAQYVGAILTLVGLVGKIIDGKW